MGDQICHSTMTKEKLAIPSALSCLPRAGIQLRRIALPQRALRSQSEIIEYSVHAMSEKSPAALDGRVYRPTMTKELRYPFRSIVMPAHELASSAADRPACDSGTRSSAGLRNY